MQKLPITALVCNTTKDKPELLMPVLTALWFCDQIVFVSDSSTDESKEIAHAFGCEVYEWLGSDNMSERRNYGVAYRGAEPDNMSEWVSHPVMSASAPVIRNEYILQADSDEIYDWDTYRELRATLNTPEDVDEKYDHWAVLLKNVNPERSRLQSTIPLERMFRNGIHWVGASHNNPRVEKLGLAINVILEHYGYDLKNHFRKQWNRIIYNEQKLLEDPDDIQLRAFLINALNVVGGGSPLMFPRILAHVDFSVEDYLKSNKDEAWQITIQKIMRFYWNTCDIMGKYGGFMKMLKLVVEDIKWHPDVSYWMFVANSKLERWNNAISCGEAFVESMRTFQTKPKNVSTEIISNGKESEVIPELVRILGHIRYDTKKDERRRLKRLARWSAEIGV